MVALVRPHNAAGGHARTVDRDTVTAELNRLLAIPGPRDDDRRRAINRCRSQLRALETRSPWRD